MNLREFEYIIAVADLLNFSAAAERCNVSQPTLSSQIRKLEEYLDIEIFERSNKKVIITENGYKIIKIAKEIIAGTKEMREIGDISKNPFAGNLKIGAFPTLSTYIFPQIVPKIHQKFPELRLILSEEKTENLFIKLKNGDVDCAFFAMPMEDNSLEYMQIMEDEFFLAVNEKHRLSGKKEINNNDLLGENLLLLEEGHCLREQALSVCASLSAGEQDFRATGLETLRLMVEAGSAITIMPKIAIKEGVNIRYIPFAEPKPTRKIGLYWRKSSAKVLLIKNVIEIINQF
jgi:LysR family hydrogen peroxide-inducible transcriptional activator